MSLCVLYVHVAVFGAFLIDRPLVCVCLSICLPIYLLPACVSVCLDILAVCRPFVSLCLLVYTFTCLPATCLCV